MNIKRFSIVLTFVCIAFCVASAFAQSGDQQAQPPTIIRKAGGVLQGSATQRVEPVFPPLAKAARISGSVVIEVTIDEAGSVMSARAISGHPLLKDAAVTAARGWKFSPTMLSGTLVKVIGTITFNFNLDKEPPNDIAGYTLKDKSDDAAIEEAKKAVAANPGSGAAYIRLAAAYEADGDLKEAAASYEKAVQLLPDQKALYVSLAHIYDRLQNHDREIATYKKALEFSPNSVELLDPLSRALSNARRYPEAIEVQKQVVQQKPDVAEAYYQLGYLCHSARDYSAAITAYLQATHLKPDFAEAYYSLARAYAGVRRDADAIATYLHITELKPQFSQIQNVYVELAETYLRMQRFSEAQAAANKAIEINPKYGNAYAISGTAYRLMGRFDEAIATFKKGVSADPYNWQMQGWLGETYLAAEQFPEAEAAFRESLRLNEYPGTYYALAFALDKQKRTGEAETVLSDGVKKSPRDANLRVMFGSLLNQHDKLAEAEAQYNEALKLDPNSALALNNLGYLWVDRGERLEEALKMIQRAVNAAPNNGAYVDSLGWAYFKLGKLDEAERYLTQAARLYIDSATVQEHLGDVYDRLGKKEMARSTWQKALFFSTDAKQSERLRSKASAVDQKK
jgi:TonB family protein